MDKQRFSHKNFEIKIHHFLMQNTATVGITYFFFVLHNTFTHSRFLRSRAMSVCFASPVSLHLSGEL